MKAKKIVAFLCCLGMVLPNTAAYAAEEKFVPQINEMKDPGNVKEELSGESSGEKSGAEESGTPKSLSSLSLLDADIEGIFSDMADSLMKGEDFSVSGAIANNSDATLSTDTMFDMSDMSLITTTALDMGSTNLKFETLSTQMMDNFESVDLSGGSSNCMSLFNNSFGDIASQVSLNNPVIPEGFTVENMLSSASENVNSAYAEAGNSGSFSSIKGNISIGSIFSVANQGLSMPKLASMDTLNGMIAGQDENNRSEISDSYLSAKHSISSAMGVYEDRLAYNANKNLLGVLDMDNVALGLDGKINEDVLKSKSDTVNGVLDSVTDTESIFDIGAAVGGVIGTGVESFLEDTGIGNKIADVGSNFVEGCSDFAGNCVDFVGGLISDAKGKISEGIDWIQGLFE